MGIGLEVRAGEYQQHGVASGVELKELDLEVMELDERRRQHHDMRCAQQQKVEL